MTYGIFARIYDELMDEELYDSWIDFTKEQLSASQTTLLDLACGSGQLALLLNDAGYDVTGLDLSAEMVVIANERAELADVSIPFLEGDMTNLKDVGTFDAITCYCDSICYLPDETAVQKTFCEVAKHLKEEGVFLFDVHSLYQMNEIFPGYTFNDQNEDICFLWKSYVGEHPHSVEHDLTFFVYQAEIDLYDRFDETHKERTYPIEQYLDMLRKAGFQSVTVSTNFGKEEVNEESTRWFFVCRK